MIPKSRIYPVLYRETTSRKKKHVTDEIGAGNGVQKMFYIPRKKKSHLRYFHPLRAMSSRLCASAGGAGLYSQAEIGKVGRGDAAGLGGFRADRGKGGDWLT
jgi:hypothetical protein